MHVFARKLAFTILSFTLGICFGHDSRAGSVSYTFDLDTNTQPGFVPLFDASLGHLSHVEIEVEAWTGSSWFANPSGSNGRYLMVLGLDGLIVRSDWSTEQTSLAYYSVEGLYSEPPSTVISVGDYVSFSQKRTDDLSVFVGDGKIGIQMLVFYWWLESPASNMNLLETSGFGGGRLTYFYGLPEPGTMAMTGLGLVALTGMVVRSTRRRQRKLSLTTPA